MCAEDFGVNEVIQAADKCCGNCSLENIVTHKRDPLPQRWVEKLDDRLNPPF